MTSFQIHTNAKIDHECGNQYMDGTYACEYCYPPCKVCGRDTSDFDVHCNKYDGCKFNVSNVKVTSN